MRLATIPQSTRYELLLAWCSRDRDRGARASMTRTSRCHVGGRTINYCSPRFSVSPWSTRDERIASRDSITMKAPRANVPRSDAIVRPFGAPSPTNQSGPPPRPTGPGFDSRRRAMRAVGRCESFSQLP